MAHPTRYSNLAEARRSHGDARVDSFGRYLRVTDPLADRAAAALAELPAEQAQGMVDRAIEGDSPSSPPAETPPALRELLAEAGEAPLWVDWEQLDLGGRAMMRSGYLGALVLGSYSLALAYCSAGGNKPLAFSGQLVEMAPRRLNETGRFVLETCLPGGLKPGGRGWKITLRVRLMHAQVRRLLRASPKWDTEAWGEPINQADMVATSLLFSHVLMDGLSRIGFELSHDEKEAIIQLWRFSGRLIGIDPALLYSNVHDAERLWDLIRLTLGPADDDSRALVQALLGAPLAEAKGRVEKAIAGHWVAFTTGFCRAMIGRARADELGLAKGTWRFSLPVIRASVSRLERARRLVPGGHLLAELAGRRIWVSLVERGLAGAPAEFRLPRALRR